MHAYQQPSLAWLHMSAAVAALLSPHTIPHMDKLGTMQ